MVRSACATAPSTSRQRARPPRPLCRRAGSRVRQWPPPWARRCIPVSRPPRARRCTRAAEWANETLGLSVTQDDTTIVPASFAATAGRPRRLHFRVVGRDGAALRSGYQLEAERRLHLIVVRRDLTGYQHLHPAMARGRHLERAAEASPSRGAYRVFADFQLRRREARARCATCSCPGGFRPAPLPAPATVATRRRLRRPAAVAASCGPADEAPLRFTVSRGGPAGRRGGAVPGRAGPPRRAARGRSRLSCTSTPRSTRMPRTRSPFAAELPFGRRYRLFLQFKIDGVVHTAAFTRRGGAVSAPRSSGSICRSRA